MSPLHGQMVTEHSPAAGEALSKWVQFSDEIPPQSRVTVKESKIETVVNVLVVVVS